MTICLFLRNKSKEQKKKKKLKNRFLLENTRFLLQGLISCGLKSNPITIFSEIDLQQASNNYHSDQFLYSGDASYHPSYDASYDFYKGIHQNRIILIKKFKTYSWDVHTTQIKRSISEIVALSQINHVNMAKLLGCCLETQCPIQVYEFCFNRNLWDCIQSKKLEATNDDDVVDQCRLLSWENRLKVATEIADAITYLHTANPKAIIHRDIRSRNVLLDQNGMAKLFDLSVSISIPSGSTHAEANIAGSVGYIAPDCLQTGQVSEKSDVFSFGMLLLELLTGNGPFSLANLAQEEVFRLWDYVKSIIREDRLREIVEPTIWKESVNGMMMMNQKQQQEFAKLAVKCIEKSEEVRPTMMEVAKELRQIKRHGV